MSYIIVYHEKVVNEDIHKLSQSTKETLKNAIEKRLTEQPEVFGKPLRSSLKNYRKLRVGDYRVIFRIENSDTVKIFIIAHRSIVYEKVLGRI